MFNIKKVQKMKEQIEKMFAIAEEIYARAWQRGDTTITFVQSLGIAAQLMRNEILKTALIEQAGVSEGQSKLDWLSCIGS